MYQPDKKSNIQTQSKYQFVGLKTSGNATLCSVTEHITPLQNILHRAHRSEHDHFSPKKTITVAELLVYVKCSMNSGD